MITDDPAEYELWQQEQAHMEHLVEEYHQEQLDKAEMEMVEILGCLASSPEYGDNLHANAQTEMDIAGSYLAQIKTILDGASKPIIASILQPLRSALIDSEFMIEGGYRVLDSRDDNV
jgi:hypothetical protein